MGIPPMWNTYITVGVVNEHGAMCWNEVFTPDVSAAADFYGKLLGWGTQSMDMGDAGEYTVFTIGDDGVGGATPPPMEGIPPLWNVIFAVDDADACAATAKSSGGQVMQEPFDMPIGRAATIADPQGAVFQVIALSEPAEN